VGGMVTSVNKEGYMTDLNSIRIRSDTEIYDLKKARALLKSVILSNPDSQSGWIAAARVEELDGKFEEARIIIEKACAKFPKDEDIWLEAARLNTFQSSKAILA
jgi:pre-mRNA-processing factor 6